MIVLLTGAAGFIGSHTGELLARAGHRVVGIDNFTPNYDLVLKQRNLEALAASASDSRFIELDLRDRKAVDELLVNIRPHIVVHCAALAGVRNSIARPVDYIENNITATVNLTEAMRAVGCTKLVFASSSSVYGDEASAPFCEDNPCISPVSPYAATKRSAELILYCNHHLSGLDVIAARLFTVYGPRQRPDLAIHQFTARIMQHKAITVYGDGSSSRDYTHVSDIAKGLAAAANYLLHHQNVFEFVNLGSSTPISLTALIEAIETACGRRAIIERVANQPGDVHKTYADIQKAAALLEWRPTMDLQSGLADFVRWWCENCSAE